jgi:RimJ/RimL family protein N-acetyltransferase
MTHRLTIDEQATLLRWAGKRLGIDSWVADSHAIGIIDDVGKICGVVVFNTVQDQQAQIHVVTDGRFGKGFISPQLIATVFAYPFYELGVLRLTAPILIDNIAAQIVALRLGFRVEGRERAGFYGQDRAIFAMLRGECMWLEEAR